MLGRVRVWLGGSSDFTIVELEHAVFTSFSERISASDFTIVELEHSRIVPAVTGQQASDFTIVELERDCSQKQGFHSALLISP